MNSIKSIVTTTFLLLQFSSALSQHSATRDPELENLLEHFMQIDTIKSDFDTRIDQLDKTNFKKLRDYRSEKEEQLLATDAKIKTISADIITLEEDLSNLQSCSMKLRQAVEETSDSLFALNKIFSYKNADKNLLSVGLFLESARGDKKYMSERIFPKLDELKSNGNAQLKILNEKLKLLIFNRRNIETDLNLCFNTIDAALAPEYKQLQTKVGLGYTVLITLGVLLVALLVGIMTGKLKPDMLTALISDSGLQFVTIFILMIAVILFGILSILEGKELAAILAGISGYILGRGSRALGDKKKETSVEEINKEEKNETAEKPKENENKEGKK